MKKGTFGLTIAGCLLAAGASASPLQVGTFLAFSIAQTSFTGGTPNITTNVGPVQVTYLGVSFNAFCGDVTRAMSHTTYEVTLNDTNSIAAIPKSEKIAWLYNTKVASATTDILGGALQLAIWDELMDGGDGLSVGQFRASSTTAVMNQAATYIGQANAATVTGQKATVYIGPSGAGQPQTLIGAAPVPEPATLLVLAPMVGYMIRRKKAARP